MKIYIPNTITTNINSSLVENSGDSMQHIDVSIPTDTSISLKDRLTLKAHINPLSTEIDIESVAYQLSHYQFSPELTVSVDDLINPKYGMDYEAHPANPKN